MLHSQAAGRRHGRELARTLSGSAEQPRVFLGGTSSDRLVGNAESHLFTADEPREFTRTSAKSPGAFNAPNAAFTARPGRRFLLFC